MTHDLGNGVMVFDPEGRLVYANEPAVRAIGGDRERASKRIDALRPRLLELGATVTPLWSRETRLGDVVVLPHAVQPVTLAERERDAIFEALQRTGGRLAETARSLGISRTTLWRRLRDYGVRAEGGARGTATGKPGSAGVTTSSSPGRAPRAGMASTTR